MSFARMACGAVAGVALFAGAAQAPAGERDAAWVEHRVEALQPTAAERAIDRIGWAADIRSALRLGARAAGRSSCSRWTGGSASAGAEGAPSP